VWPFEAPYPCNSSSYFIINYFSIPVQFFSQVASQFIFPAIDQNLGLDTRNRGACVDGEVEDLQHVHLHGVMLVRRIFVLAQPHQVDVQYVLVEFTKLGCKRKRRDGNQL